MARFSEFWLPPRHMPEMENFDLALLFIDLVVDLQRRVQEQPNSGVSLHSRSQEREIFEKINVIEQRIGEPLAGFRVFLPRPSHDFLQVV